MHSVLLVGESRCRIPLTPSCQLPLSRPTLIRSAHDGPASANSHVKTGNRNGHGHGYGHGHGRERPAFPALHMPAILLVYKSSIASKGAVSHITHSCLTWLKTPQPFLPSYRRIGSPASDMLSPRSDHHTPTGLASPPWPRSSSWSAHRARRLRCAPTS